MYYLRTDEYFKLIFQVKLLLAVVYTIERFYSSCYHDSEYSLADMFSEEDHPYSVSYPSRIITSLKVS